MNRGTLSSRSCFTQMALALLLVTVLPTSAMAEDGESPSVPIDLAVLYAGNPGSQRMRDFEAFLSQHFEQVGTADYEKFQPADADDFDVVIFDWTSIYPRDKQGKITWDNEMSMSQPTPPKLDRSFDRPSVLIGGAAGTLSHQLQTAINWKCLCLENFAHDTAVTHPIFQGPLPVGLEWTDREKPADYYLAPGTESLGESIPVWKVQEKSFPEIDPGLVSSRENFAQTPDAEVISGGINGKGPTSVALGRHGNFFLWGFSAQPSDMTESARHAFVNTLCYMKQFDGKTAGPVQPKFGGRESFLAEVYFLRSVADEYIERQVEQYEQMIRDNPPPEEQLRQIGDDPAEYFRSVFAPHAERIREKLDPEVRDRCGDDTQQLIRFYRDNLEYLRSDGNGGFEVDEDVQRLGVSNRKLALLEKCVVMMESGDKVELAERVLERYTGQTLESTAEWREWLEAERDNLQFDESSGQFANRHY